MKQGIIIAAVLALAAAGAYWQLGRKPASNPVSEAVEEFSGNLQAAMAKNIPMHCIWSSNGDKGESFVQGGNVYAVNTVQGKTGYMIKKDDCIWSWSDNQPQGIKICQEPKAVGEEDSDWEQPEAGGFKAEGIDWDVQYQCRPAVFGAEKFTPPDAVEFTDMEAMFKNMMPQQEMPELPVKP